LCKTVQSRHDSTLKGEDGLVTPDVEPEVAPDRELLVWSKGGASALV